MTRQRIMYAAVIVVGVGIGAVFRYARYRDVDLPMWFVVPAVLTILALIGWGISIGRRNSKRRVVDRQPHRS